MWRLLQDFGKRLSINVQVEPPWTVQDVVERVLEKLKQPNVLSDLVRITADQEAFPNTRQLDQRAIVQRFSAYQAHIVGSMHGCESALATRSPEREDADEQMAELAADDDREATTEVSSDCDGESDQEVVSMLCHVAKSQL